VVAVNGDTEVVKIHNDGNVKVNLAGWVLKNSKNGKKATLPSFSLAPGKVVKVHSGKGTTARLHIYLGKREMWGAHGKAVLRDGSGSLAAKLRY
jgi:hypothetical protein